MFCWTFRSGGQIGANCHLNCVKTGGARKHPTNLNGKPSRHSPKAMLHIELRLAGFGKAILSLAALMLLLYSLVIYEEVAKNAIFQKFLLDTVARMWNEHEYLP